MMAKKQYSSDLKTIPGIFLLHFLPGSPSSELFNSYFCRYIPIYPE